MIYSRLNIIRISSRSNVPECLERSYAWLNVEVWRSLKDEIWTCIPRKKKRRTFQRDTVVVYLFTKNRLTRNLHGPGTIGYNHRQQRGSMTLQNESENMHSWLLSSRGEHGEQRTAQTQHRIKYQAWYLAHTCRTCNRPGKPSLSLTELHHFWQPENKPGSNSRSR